MDKLVAMIREDVEPNAAPKYNKYYIGLEVNGAVTNFLAFRPRKHHVGLDFKIPPNPDLTAELEEAGVPVLSYQARWGSFRIQLSPASLAGNEQLIRRMIKMRARTSDPPSNFHVPGWEALQSKTD